MKIDGACHCGSITYEAEIDPKKVAICHCTDCQTLSGSPYRAFVPAAPGLFKLLTGQPKVYVKRAETGAERAQGFCPECGTPIYSAGAKDTSSFVLRMGAIRQRAELRPHRQYWCRSSLAWVTDLGLFRGWPNRKAWPTFLAVLDQRAADSCRRDLEHGSR